LSAIDTSFSLETLDAFPLRLGERSEWEGFLGAGAGRAGRSVFRPGWRTVYSSTVEAAFFRLRLADGTTGWGEPNAPVGPEIVCRIAENLLLPILAGRSFPDPAAMWDFLYDTQRGRGHFAGFYLDAIAGLEIAVWDALARRAGLPLAALLCERPRREIPVYLSGLRRESRAPGPTTSCFARLRTKWNTCGVPTGPCRSAPAWSARSTGFIHWRGSRGIVCVLRRSARATTP
jgi:hypothetical protein